MTMDYNNTLSASNRVKFRTVVLYFLLTPVSIYNFFCDVLCDAVILVFHKAVLLAPKRHTIFLSCISVMPCHTLLYIYFICLWRIGKQSCWGSFGSSDCQRWLDLAHLPNNNNNNNNIGNSVRANKKQISNSIHGYR